jgi:hypothetical protein
MKLITEHRKGKNAADCALIMDVMDVMDLLHVRCVVFEDAVVAASHVVDSGQLQSS